MKFVEASLERISLDDRTFDLSFVRRYEGLWESVRAVGVLQPLLVRERADHAGYQIVCGFGRAHAARALGLTQLLVRILPPETTDADCLRLSLFDNLGHRYFNPIERAMILNEFGRHIDRRPLISNYVPLLGIQPSAILFDRTLTLMKLIDGLKKAVAEGRIEEKVGVEVAALTNDDQEAFAYLLERSQASVSIAREWAQALVDVARRDNRSLCEILAAPEVRLVLASENLEAGDRIAAIRRYLNYLRYPTVSACEERFAEARAALRMPPGMRLVPATSFESDEMSLEIRFRNEEELRSAAKVLQRWFDDPDLLKRLWPLRSESDRR